MSSQNLPAKLQIKHGHKVKLVNAPAGMAVLLVPLRAGATLAGPAARTCDVVLLFVEHSDALSKHFIKAVGALAAGGVLWVLYPKGTSKNYQTDLNRDKGWNVLYDAGYIMVSSISIDEDWTGLRARQGTAEEIEKWKNWKVTTKKDTAGRIVEVPPDLAAALKKNTTAQKIFDGFAYTHRKEYVRWVTEAKKQETRERRVAKTIEMIAANKKFS